MNGLLDWIRRPPAPHDFGATLDALRVLRELAIHTDSADDFIQATEALDVIEAYVYDRATDDEMHKRAER